ncbi:MAG TPA: DUF2019 domain-containing protein [Pseudobacteroides sp.]|uniref:DUF2019 domain-containing protein n=1 Tax=Pseudobacteroides sp. TaxID=1968840 RepID=UPI002F91DAE0
MCELEKLIQTLVQESIKQEEATLVGDSNMMNKQYAKIRKIRESLRRIGNIAFSDIISLLSHENSYVRYNASFVIIPFFPEEAKKTLVEISKLNSSIGFTAEMTLREWDKGNLEF